MSHSVVKLTLAALFVLAAVIPGNSQGTGLPDAFKQESIPGQLKYLNEHTKIYENYRAIREDMFRAVNKNIIDSIIRAKQTISHLNRKTASLNSRIDSLNNILAGANASLDKATRTKESIKVLGIEVNKATYNSIMWIITGILLLLLATGYVTFKQNRATTMITRKELKELTEEFEEYKNKTRIEREKTTVEHFNEIKKLKAGLPGSRS